MSGSTWQVAMSMKIYWLKFLKHPIFWCWKNAMTVLWPSWSLSQIPKFYTSHQHSAWQPVCSKLDIATLVALLYLAVGHKFMAGSCRHHGLRSGPPCFLIHIDSLISLKLFCSLSLILGSAKMSGKNNFSFVPSDDMVIFCDIICDCWFIDFPGKMLSFEIR